jgi:hypothetical protein
MGARTTATSSVTMPLGLLHMPVILIDGFVDDAVYYNSDRYLAGICGNGNGALNAMSVVEQFTEYIDYQCMTMQEYYSLVAITYKAETGSFVTVQDYHAGDSTLIHGWTAHRQGVYWNVPLLSDEVELVLDKHQALGKTGL